jgi:hypothetical protein
LVVGRLIILTISFKTCDFELISASGGKVWLTKHCKSSSGKRFCKPLANFPFIPDANFICATGSREALNEWKAKVAYLHKI